MSNGNFQRTHILGWVFDWVVSRFLWFYVQTSLQDIWHTTYAFVTEEGTQAKYGTKFGLCI